VGWGPRNGAQCPFAKPGKSEKQFLKPGVTRETKKHGNVPPKGEGTRNRKVDVHNQETTKKTGAKKPGGKKKKGGRTVPNLRGFFPGGWDPKKSKKRLLGLPTRKGCRGPLPGITFLIHPRE